MAQSNPLKSTQFQNRIKKIMQADEDVGKVAAGATYLVGRSCALEAFLDTLLTGAVDLATTRNARTLTSAHLKASITASPLLDFCKDSVASAPDLPPSGSDNPVAPKRRRAGELEEGGSAPKQGKGRGGRGKNSVARPSVEPALVEGATAEVDPNEEAPVEAFATTVMNATYMQAAPGQQAEEEDYDV